MGSSFPSAFEAHKGAHSLEAGTMAAAGNRDELLASFAAVTGRNEGEMYLQACHLQAGFVPHSWLAVQTDLTVPCCSGMADQAVRSSEGTVRFRICAPTLSTCAAGDGLPARPGCGAVLCERWRHRRGRERAHGKDARCGARHARADGPGRVRTSSQFPLAVCPCQPCLSHLQSLACLPTRIPRLLAILRHPTFSGLPPRPWCVRYA